MVASASKSVLDRLANTFGTLTLNLTKQYQRIRDFLSIPRWKIRRGRGLSLGKQYESSLKSRTFSWLVINGNILDVIEESPEDSEDEHGHINAPAGPGTVNSEPILEEVAPAPVSPVGFGNKDGFCDDRLKGNSKLEVLSVLR